MRNLIGSVGIDVSLLFYLVGLCPTATYQGTEGLAAPPGYVSSGGYSPSVF